MSAAIAALASYGGSDSEPDSEPEAEADPRPAAVLASRDAVLHLRPPPAAPPALPVDSAPEVAVKVRGGRDPGGGGAVGSAASGSARRRSGLFGRVRLGSAGLGSVRVRPAPLGWARPRSAPLGFVRLRSAPLGSWRPARPLRARGAEARLWRPPREGSGAPSAGKEGPRNLPLCCPLLVYELLLLITLYTHTT